MPTYSVDDPSLVFTYDSVTVALPCCGFAFDVDHVDDGSDPPTYTCPNCQDAPPRTVGRGPIIFGWQFKKVAWNWRSVIIGFHGGRNPVSGKPFMFVGLGPFLGLDFHKPAEGHFHEHA
jgi:hypothetical protein